MLHAIADMCFGACRAHHAAQKIIRFRSETQTSKTDRLAALAPAPKTVIRQAFHRTSGVVCWGLSLKLCPTVRTALPAWNCVWPNLQIHNGTIESYRYSMRHQDGWHLSCYRGMLTCPKFLNFSGPCCLCSTAS